LDFDSKAVLAVMLYSRRGGGINGNFYFSRGILAITRLSVKSNMPSALVATES